MTSLSAAKENYKVDLYSKVVYYVISPTYTIKEIEKVVLCVCNVMIYLRNVKKILEKRVKH